MEETEIAWPAGVDAETAAAAVEHSVAAAGLRTTLKGTVKKHPGCLHWHLKSGKGPGTLEVTLWPQARRLWLSVQGGRGANWIEAARADLVQRIAAQLAP